MKFSRKLVFSRTRGEEEVSSQSSGFLRQWNYLVCYANAVMDVILAHFSKPIENAVPRLNSALLSG